MSEILGTKDCGEGVVLVVLVAAALAFAPFSSFFLSFFCFPRPTAARYEEDGMMKRVVLDESDVRQA